MTWHFFLNNALVNITAGNDITLHEVHETVGELISSHGGSEANVRFGLVIKESMHGRVRVTVLATARTRAVQEAALETEQPFERRRQLDTLELPKRRGISFLDLAEGKDEGFYGTEESEELLAASSISGDWK